MKAVIDRFEGEYAVCEKDDRTMIKLKKNEIPLTAKEGDVLIIEAGSIILDEEETEKRKREIERLTEDMWQ